MVSIVDSVALLFVVCHFAWALYVYGHHRTLQRAEAKYEAAAVKYNEKAERVSADNVAIAQSAQVVAQEQTKAEKLRNDTAYQTRKAAEAGARLPGARAASAPAGIGTGLTTSVIELEKPERPAESSAAFLASVDWAVRAANWGELFLACLTLILIRTVSAMSNTSTAPPRSDNYVDAVSPHRPPRGRLGFAEAQDGPHDNRPKAPRNWI